MPQDVEQATERTKLLYHVANDRRLSAVQQEEDAQSMIASYVSKEEQALSSAPVGERLPYNDYTTIDWLHDLVSSLRASWETELTSFRSKAPIATVLFTQSRGFAMPSFLLSTTARAGSPRPLLAYSLPVSRSLWMWPKRQ